VPVRIAAVVIAGRVTMVMTVLVQDEVSQVVAVGVLRRARAV
jgi:hypothetical protein